MTKKGSWSSIGSGGWIPGKDTVSMPVFDMWIEHLDLYSYTVLPAATPAKVAAFAASDWTPARDETSGYWAVMQKDGQDDVLLAAVWSNSTVVRGGDSWRVLP